MAKKVRATITAAAILRQIDWLLENATFYDSKERGKRFYDAHGLPSMLASYVARHALTIAAAARQFGMSGDTLKRLMSGRAISDTMLMRLRSALSEEAKRNARQATFGGDWHEATSAKVASAIADVSDRLVFLKKVITSNNHLLSEDSPIDRIQVLQLIALLTATIEALRAPLIDKKQAGGFFRWLARFAKTSAQKGLEKLVVDAMNDAAHSGAHLVHELSTQAGIPDLGSLLGN
jgi:hypothetical protein